MRRKLLVTIMSIVLFVGLVCCALAAGPGETMIRVTPVLIPAPPSASWTSAADKIIADCLAERLTNTIRSGPADYVLCNYRIGWSNLVYSKTGYMWNGILNCPAPYDFEYGCVVWFVIDAISPLAGDNLSLDMLSVNFVSSDGELNSSMTYGDRGYSRRAICLRSNGTIIDNGASSGKGRRVIVIEQSALFNVGGTQAGLDSVKNYIQYQVTETGNYWLTCTARQVGVDSTKSIATVSVYSKPAIPVLRIVPGKVDVKNSTSSQTYRLFSVPAVVGAPWQFEGVINGSEPYPLNNVGNKFFRVVVQ